MKNLGDIALATLISSWIFTVLVLLALVLQCYTKYRILRQGYDGSDCLTILTFFCSLALVCQTTWAVVNEGQGRHAGYETLSQFELVAKSLTANEVVWTFIAMLIRCTAITFTKRLFKGIWRLEKIVIVTFCLTIMHGASSILAACLICRPIAADWDFSSNGICGNQAIAFIVFESVGLILDVGIILVPWYAVWAMSIPMKKKVMLVCIFGIGGLNIVFTGLRFASLQQVTSNDFTYDRGFLGLLSCLGALSGVLLGIVPTLMPLFRR